MSKKIVYSNKLANEICQAIAESNKGLSHICKANPEFPTRKTIYKWLVKYPEFGDKYARAKELQAELLVDELIEIADDGKNDYYTTSEGKEVFDHEHVNRSRLRIDTRKWLASKLLPKVYGDKITAEHTGKDGEALPTNITVEFVKNNTADENPNT